MMVAEMQLTFSFSWLSHLEAARRIVNMFGGVNECINKAAPFGRMILSYMVVDILAAATTPTHLVKPSSALEQLEYLQLLEVHEEELLSCWCPCPVKLLQAVVHANVLRHCAKDPNVLKGKPVRSYEAVWQDVETFDAHAWAVHISKYGRTEPKNPEQLESDPDIAALTSMAVCFQCAAHLYIILGRANPNINRFTLAILQSTQQVLADQISFLFSMADEDCYGPLPTQLWRLVTWPLVISVYARYGCGIGGDSSVKHIEMLKKMSNILGSRPMGDAVDAIKKMEDERGNGPTQKVDWDTAFPFVG
jgi:hypothetical protein